VIYLSLERLKVKLGINDTTQDTLLNILLEDAEQTLLDLTNQETLPAQLESTQEDIAILSYNKIGNEGESSRGEGGISRSFEKDLSEPILKKIRKYRRLPRL
jgi:transposase